MSGFSAVRELRGAVSALKTYLAGKFEFDAQNSELLLSLWIIHTHFFDIFSSSPPLLISTGKAALVPVSEELTLLSFNGKRVFLTSPFIEFSFLKNGPSTLVVENLEGLALKRSKKLPEFISFVLRSSHEGLFLQAYDRASGRTEEVDAFQPKAFVLPLEALTAGELDALLDGSLVLKVKNIKGAADYSDMKEVGLAFKGVFEACKSDMRIALKREVPKLLGEASRERRRVFEPLFLIAQLCGEDILREASDAMLSAEAELKSRERRILEEALCFVEEKGLEEVESVDLARRLYEKGLIRPFDPESPASLGKALSQSLRAFGIRPVSIKRRGKVFKGYRKKDVQKALELKRDGPLDKSGRS